MPRSQFVHEWGKALVATIVSLLLGAGAVFLSLTPQVSRHEKLLEAQANDTREISETLVEIRVKDIGGLREDVAVIKTMLQATPAKTESARRSYPFGSVEGSSR